MKRLIRLIFLYIFIGGLLFSCSHIKTINKDNNIYVGNIDVVDLTFIDNRNLIGPYFGITVQGSDYLAFFDTGSENTALMLNDTILSTLNLEYIGEAESYVLDPQQPLRISKKYKIPEIEINGRVTIYDNNIESQIFEVYDVIAGLDLFKDYNFLISYLKKKIYLFHKDFVPSDIVEKWAKVKINDGFKGLQFKANVVGLTDEYIFYLDTGAISSSQGIYRDRIFNTVLQNKIKADNYNPLEYVIGGKHLKRGHTQIASPSMPVGTPEVFLGYAFLNQYEVFVDQQNKCIYMDF